MTNERIITLCKEKEKELLEKRFAELLREVVKNGGETVDESSKEIPLRIESEYKVFLENLWSEYAPAGLRDKSLVLEEQKLRKLMTDDNREEVDVSYESAMKQTLLERLTNTNYKDVAIYTSVLADYAKDLLLVMRCDFLEEITGNHIKNKTFEHD